ncbi:hypothetical protein D3C84_573080 [compost metagenome]
MRVAGQHQCAGAHRTARTTYLRGAAVDQLQHRALLEDLHAKGFCELRLAQGQIQRVQVPRAHVDQTARVHAGVHNVLTDLPGGNQSGLMAVTRLDQFRLFGLHRGELCRRIGQFAEAPAQVAIDTVFADTLGHHLHRLDAGVLKVLHAVVTDVFGKTADVMPDAADQLTAVAPAGAPANPPGFQQNHRETALGQFDGGVDTGETATDHTDVGHQVRVQRWARRHAVGRCCVIGMGVFAGVLIHLLDFTLLHERVIRRMIGWGGVVDM